MGFEPPVPFQICMSNRFDLQMNGGCMSFVFKLFVSNCRVEIVSQKPDLSVVTNNIKTNTTFGSVKFRSEFALKFTYAL